MERLQDAVPATPVVQDGHRIWLSEDSAPAQASAIDGRLLAGATASPQRSSSRSRGREQRSRSTIEFPHEQASLTGLGVVLTLSAALGLEGNSSAMPGIYLPEQLSEAEWFLAQLTHLGCIHPPGRQRSPDVRASSKSPQP